jgi:hypothetical protein
LKFQNQLRLFFASKEGKIWVSIFKNKSLKRSERIELLAKFKTLLNSPDEIALTQGD